MRPHVMMHSHMLHLQSATACQKVLLNVTFICAVPTYSEFYFSDFQLVNRSDLVLFSISCSYKVSEFIEFKIREGILIQKRDLEPLRKQSQILNTSLILNFLPFHFVSYSYSHGRISPKRFFKIKVFVIFRNCRIFCM